MQKVRYDWGLGQNLRQLRKAKNLTQEQLVAKMQIAGCSLSRETYAKIEIGIANIKVQELKALTKILDTDYNHIFAEEEER